MNGVIRIILKFINFILPYGLIIYICLPLFKIQDPMRFFIILSIITLLLIYYIIKERNYLLSWILAIIIVVLISTIYFIGLYEFKMIFSLFIIMSSPIFVVVYMKKWNKNKDIESLLKLYVYLFFPIAFLLFMMLLTVIMERITKYFNLSEEIVVSIIFLIFVFIVAVYVYLLLSGFYKTISKINKKVKRNATGIKSKLYTSLLFLGIIIGLISPDIIILYLGYDFYLNLIGFSDYNWFDLYYYGFSIHFLTPISETGKVIQEYLLGTYLGKALFIIHALIIRLIDVTILASVIKMWTTNNESRINGN